jgi:putative nucleotidyltransferase with HDIG domain
MALSLTIRRILSIQPVDLPVFHPIAVRLQQLLDSMDFTIDEVVRLASEDQALAGQILRMANSVVYVGRVRVETIKEAVVRLGALQVANLAMAASQASLHVSESKVISRNLQKLWQHSHACAVGCRWLALQAGYPHLADQAYMAGLLHDVGKLYLLKALERLNKSGVAEMALEEELLLEIFQELHVEQGVRLMQHWNMPQAYIDAVAYHHAENLDSNDVVLTIVRLVNIACRKVSLSLTPDVEVTLPALAETELLRLSQFQLDELLVALQDSTLPITEGGWE